MNRNYQVTTHAKNLHSISGSVITNTMRHFTAKLGDISIQAKLLIVIASSLGVAISLATLLVSSAINQFETRVTEAQLTEEKQLTEIHFSMQERELQKIAAEIVGNEVLNTAVAITDRSTIKNIVATLRLQHNLDYVEVVGAANQTLFDQPFEAGPELSELLEQALQRNENISLLYTHEGWLLSATAPVVNPVGVIGAISVGRILDDELLTAINMNRVSPILHLHGPDGAVLATSMEYPDHRQEEVDLNLWRRALAGEVGRAPEIEEQTLHHVIYAPLNINHTVAAVYSIEISTKEIQTLQQQLIVQTLFLLLGIGLAAAFLIYILMRQFITTPLVTLGEAARKIGAGNLNVPLPPISGNEIGQLTFSFGIMVNQLRQSFTTLEKRVAERTTELTKSNNQLQREIEERGKVEVELIIARDKAVKASRLKTELLAKVSHELRTPLGAILGYAELLHDGMYGSLTSRQEVSTQKIINSAYYLSGMVNDLLDQAQLEAGKLTLNIAAFNPSEVVAETVSKMDVLAQSKELTLTSEIAPNVLTALSGDATRLQQILVNLTSNAIKFTKTGSIKIQLYCPDSEHWAMSVSDTGPGIPPEARSLIFEPFGQVDGSMTRKHSGTGLGLSIVQHLVDLMGGQIILDSEVGRGSIFTVTLPLQVFQERTS